VRCAARATTRRRADRARSGAAAVSLALVALLVLAAACTSDDPARAAAERFVDRYYVEIDLPRALDESTGLARAKVEKEISLLVGVAPPEEAMRPRIHYRFVEQQDPGRDRRGFVYELTISFDGGEQLQRRALVTVREDEGTWRAVNFQEID
jgi:hypothetical protein